MSLYFNFSWSSCAWLCVNIDIYAFCLQTLACNITEEGNSIQTFCWSQPTFEFEQLVSQLGPRQLMDAVRHWVLVIKRLVAGVHDWGAIQQGHVTSAVVERKKVTLLKCIREWYDMSFMVSGYQLQLSFRFYFRQNLAWISLCLVCFH